jgi:NAD+ kinase
VTAREVLLVVHTGRPAAVKTAADVCRRLCGAGVEVRVLDTEADDLDIDGAIVVPADKALTEGVELVIVLGGDGTLLRAAELARPAGTPLLGVNLGRVGFLAEAEPAALDATVERVLEGRYGVERRMTLDVVVYFPDGRSETGWALNEATVEKGVRERMLEVVVEIDGRPLSTWGCDGVVMATPTGSTAYAFSAGGPVVWPELEALLVVPISAHALFSRPLVAAPSSVLAVEVLPGTPGVLWCDGRRTLELAPRSRIEVRASPQPLRLARLHHRPFTDRLVAKFGLPVRGWRGHVD